MQIAVYNTQGEQVRNLELNPGIFGIKPNSAVLHEVVVAQRANSRQVSANTKTRGEVSGGGKKTWKQKGTGRARQGSIRSPQWKGGGVVFGPRANRNFSKKINRKVRNAAIRMALSDKVAAGSLLVMEGLGEHIKKTKEIAAVLKSLPLKRGRTLFALPKAVKPVGRLAANIDRVTPIWTGSLNVQDLLKNVNMVTTVEGVKEIETIYRAK